MQSAHTVQIALHPATKRLRMGCIGLILALSIEDDAFPRCIPNADSPFPSSAHQTWWSSMVQPAQCPFKVRFPFHHPKMPSREAPVSPSVGDLGAQQKTQASLGAIWQQMPQAFPAQQHIGTLKAQHVSISSSSGDGRAEAAWGRGERLHAQD